MDSYDKKAPREGRGRIGDVGYLQLLNVLYSYVAGVDEWMNACTDGKIDELK